MSRRNFLRKLGMGVAAIPLANQVTAKTYPTKNNRPLLKLGVLVPDSNRYPLLADNFLDGLRLSINDHDNNQHHEIELFIERYQTRQCDLRHKATKLAEYHQVDMMTGLIGGYDSYKIKPILEAREIVLLENTLGETLQPKLPESACMFRNSFNLWNSSYVSGTWAAKHLGTRCIVASSFYDSGFANVAAFCKAFEEAGGTVLQTCITGIQEDEGYGELFSDIREAKPDFVVGFYSGNDAISFVHSYAHEGVAVPLLGTGLLCSDTNLQVQAAKANNIISLSSWLRKLENKANNSFVRNFESTHNRYADAYSVLGFESGQLFRSVLSKVRAQPTTDDMIKAFTKVTIESPRGTLRMHNQNMIAPIYLKKVKQENGYYIEKAIDQFAMVDIESSIIDDLRTSIQS